MLARDVPMLARDLVMLGGRVEVFRGAPRVLRRGPGVQNEDATPEISGDQAFGVAGCFDALGFFCFAVFR